MKKFVMGLLLGAGLMFSVSAYAEEVANFVGLEIEGQFPVKVNGEGISTPGIVVEGTSYLPTRTIAEVFGAEVKFDAATGIELNAKQEQSTPIAGLKMHPLQNSYNEIVQKMTEVVTQKLQLENELTKIKTTHATKNQDTSALESQIAELSKQYEELEAEKAALKEQILGASQ